MDSPGLDERRHRSALDGLRRINRLSRTAAQVWQDIEPLTAQLSRPLRVLDIGCGGGDVAVAVERCARHAGVDIDIRGCDKSAVAVGHANERSARLHSGARFFTLDVLGDELPDDFDVVYCTLFLHHLDDEEAAGLLAGMRRATGGMVVVHDLVRGRGGYVLAHLAVHLLTRSDVVHVDALRSVRAAFTLREVLGLAARAGLHGARLRRCWPQRFSLTWTKP